MRGDVAENRMIDILLSTYNGEEFLREQIDSILAQTEREWRLLIRDDGSEDSTLKIIETYTSEYPGKIVLSDDDISDPLGPCQSFHQLMRMSSAPYVMFCDQDDVWMPDKIEKMLNVLMNLEKRNGEKTPILVHSDLQVVDSHLELIYSSFFKCNHLNPDTFHLPQLTFRNSVTGCACICNRALIDISLPLPSEAIMHDWWIAMTATLLGKVFCMSEPLVKYRQHSKNVLGVATWSGRITKNFRFKKYKNKLNDISRQTKAFYKAFQRSVISDRQNEFLSGVASFYTASYFQKRIIILKYAIQGNSMIKTLIMLVFA